jgi:hypothetical protein
VVGPALAQHFYCLEPAADVPARHHIGEGVVIHVLVVLVWPYHVADVPLIICLHHRAGRPKSGRFQQDLRAGAKEESVISSEAPILPHRIGDVGADVVLHPAGQDGHLLTVGPNHAFGRGLLASVG